MIGGSLFNLTQTQLHPSSYPITPSHSISSDDFHDDMRALLTACGGHGMPTLLLATEAQLKNDAGMWEGIHHLVEGGEWSVRAPLR